MRISCRYLSLVLFAPLLNALAAPVDTGKDTGIDLNKEYVATPSSSEAEPATPPLSPSRQSSHTEWQASTSQLSTHHLPDDASSSSTIVNTKKGGPVGRAHKRQFVTGALQRIDVDTAKNVRVPALAREVDDFIQKHTGGKGNTMRGNDLSLEGKGSLESLRRKLTRTMSVYRNPGFEPYVKQLEDLRASLPKMSAKLDDDRVVQEKRKQSRQKIILRRKLRLRYGAEVVPYLQRGRRPKADEPPPNIARRRQSDNMYYQRKIITQKQHREIRQVEQTKTSKRKASNSISSVKGAVDIDHLPKSDQWNMPKSWT
jgi:hypothetical protein